MNQARFVGAGWCRPVHGIRSPTCVPFEAGSHACMHCYLAGLDWTGEAVCGGGGWLGVGFEALQ